MIRMYFDNEHVIIEIIDYITQYISNKFLYDGYSNDYNEEK